VLPFLTKTKVDDLMDIEKDAHNSTIKFKHSQNFGFGKNVEPSFLDILDIKFEDVLN
jgi:hypothetical protein